jgi:hypothetical protein
MTDYGMDDLGSKVNGRDVVPLDDDGNPPNRDEEKTKQRKAKIKAKNKERKEKYNDLTTEKGLNKAKAGAKKKNGDEDESIANAVDLRTQNDWRTIGNEEPKGGCSCTIS